MNHLARSIIPFLKYFGTSRVSKVVGMAVSYYYSFYFFLYILVFFIFYLLSFIFYLLSNVLVQKVFYLCSSFQLSWMFQSLSPFRACPALVSGGLGQSSCVLCLFHFFFSSFSFFPNSLSIFRNGMTANVGIAHIITKIKKL